MTSWNSENMKDKDAIIIDENHLIVDGEWKDGGLMQKIVLYIKQNGQIEYGCILCEGEDQHDIWEILIWDKKPFIHELGSMITSYRFSSKEWFNSPDKVMLH